MLRHRLPAALLAALAAVAVSACGAHRTATPPTTVPTGAQAWQPGDPTGGDTTTDPTAGAYTTPATTTPTSTTAPAAGPVLPQDGPLVPTPLDAAQVNRADAAAVARAVLQTWFAWNTAVDQTQNDAAARAAALLSPELRKRISTPTPPEALFRRFQAKSADVRPAVIDVDAAPKAPTMRYRIVLTALGPTHTAVDTATKDVTVTVRKATAGWEVSTIDPT